MRALLQTFIADRSAATAVEYALIGTIISLACLIGMGALSNSVQDMLQEQGTAVDDAWTSRAH